VQGAGDAVSSALSAVSSALSSARLTWGQAGVGCQGGASPWRVS